MNKILVVFAILTILIAVKFVSNNYNRSASDDLSHMQNLSPGKPEEGSCISIDRFMMNYPDATSEEIFEMEECNRKRAKKLGLDKRNTGFLGNRIIRPKGALAHYEGGYGSFVFTLYEDHISAKDAGDSHEISLSSIKTVKKSGDSIVIEYETKNGKLKRYGLMLMGGDNLLKAEGNTDLDRLVELVNQLREEPPQ